LPLDQAIRDAEQAGLIVALTSRAWSCRHRLLLGSLRLTLDVERERLLLGAALIEQVDDLNPGLKFSPA